MKFKTQEQLNEWISQKRSVDYKTDLGNPLTKEEIQVILNKPNSTTIGEYDRIKDKFESRIKNMKLIHILIIILTITSCGPTNSSEVKGLVQSGEIKSEEITYPVKLHYVQRSGMKYMIASAKFGESGVHIQNLTLDSLQVEFYKKELEK